MNPTIYIDQNILSYLVDDVLFLPAENVQIVFSETHFKEIPPERPKAFLKALDTYHARLVKINLNKRFEIQDNATIYDFTPAEQLYDSYLSRSTSAGIDDVFDPILTRLFGSRDTTSYNAITTKFTDFINSQFKNNDVLHPLEIPLSMIMERLLVEINAHLKDVPCIENQRSNFGTDKGKISNFSGEDVVIKIFDHIKNKVNIDFRSILKKTLTGKPIYLKVSALNTFLNHIGYQSDKSLSSADRIGNVKHDSEHISNAIFCNYFMTEDRRLANRALAVYKHLSLGTHVINLLIDQKI